MRTLTIIFVFAGIYFYNIEQLTNGQSVDYPETFYKPIVFDYTLRGDMFNSSDCLKELLTCWELIRPDIICHDNFHVESICSWMKDLCHDHYGDLDLVWFDFVMFEHKCPYYDAKRTK